MATQLIKNGANAIIDRTLKQADGTQLLYADLTYAAVQLRQGRMVRRTLVLGEDDELRQGPGSDALRLEITAEIRAALAPGIDLELHWFTHVDDTDFTVDDDTDKDGRHDPAVDVFTLES